MNRRDFIARAGAMLAMASTVAIASMPRRHYFSREYDTCMVCGASSELIENSPPFECSRGGAYAAALVEPTYLTEKSIEDLLRQLWDNKRLRIYPRYFIHGPMVFSSATKEMVFLGGGPARFRPEQANTDDQNWNHPQAPKCFVERSDLVS